LWEVETKELSNALDAYDFDCAETLLSEIKAKSLSRQNAPHFASLDLRNLVVQLERFAARIDDHDAMTENDLDLLLEESFLLRSQASATSLKRSLSSYDFQSASAQLQETLQAMREHMEAGGEI